MSFFSSGFFWFLMGTIFILAAAGFKHFAEDRGWVLNWWKWVLIVVWYTIFSLTWYGFGTLMGETYESYAAIRILIFGMVISLILGVGLWRLLLIGKKTEETPPAAEVPEAAEA